jgi:hypothetical protein
LPGHLVDGFATVELAVSVLTEFGAFSFLRKENFNRAQFRELIHQALTVAPVSVRPLMMDKHRKVWRNPDSRQRIKREGRLGRGG